MTATIVEAMTDATAEIHAAALEMRTARVEFAATANANLQQTSSIVQQATPLSRTWYVDPVNGSDTDAGRDGSGRGKEFKTIEAVLALAAPATKHLLVLLGDIEFGKRVGQYADITIVGSAYADALSGATVNTQRRLSFRPEATNSPLPAPYGGRHTAGLFIYSAQLSFVSIDLVIPDVPAGVAYPVALVCAGFSAVTAQSSTLNGTTASNIGRFVGNGDSTPVSFYYGGTIGPGMSGRVFSGIAAGADPNVGKHFDTNLTTN